jgi:hypothetical protein
LYLPRSGESLLIDVGSPVGADLALEETPILVRMPFIDDLFTSNRGSSPSGGGVQPVVLLITPRIVVEVEPRGVRRVPPAVRVGLGDARTGPERGHPWFEHWPISCSGPLHSLESTDVTP